jgi:uncharacterized protein YjiS (DUF1127 family)
MPNAASHSLTNDQCTQPSLTARGVAAVQAIVHAWRRSRARRRERQVFAQLDERGLRDLGLSRWDVDRELKKPFWHDSLRGRISPFQ